MGLRLHLIFYEARHTYASEMDLKELNSNLFGTEIKIDGNKVTIKNQSLRGNGEQTVEIPEEYFEGCETDKDREYLVKRWLVESRHDDNIENIPYELLKAADDTHFYSLDDHRMYMDYDTKLREAGIKIGKFEKSNEFRKPNIINFEVNGKKYRMETFAEKKSRIILGASSILGSPFNNYPFANVIKNIIDSSSGKFVREGSYETFTPKLHVGVPTLKNKSIINHGTAHESAYTNQSAMYKLSKEVVGHFDEENVKEIIYIEDSSSPKRKKAYSYYDDVNDDQYLYLFDERKMLKQDSDGNIYQKQIENYEDFPWVKVNEY